MFSHPGVESLKKDLETAKKEIIQLENANKLLNEQLKNESAEFKKKIRQIEDKMMRKYEQLDKEQQEFMAGVTKKLNI